MFLKISEQHRSVNKKQIVKNVTVFCLPISIKNNKHVNSYQGFLKNTLLITNIDHPEITLIRNFCGLPSCNVLITRLHIKWQKWFYLYRLGCYNEFLCAQVCFCFGLVLSLGFGFLGFFLLESKGSNTKNVFATANKLRIQK